VNPPGIIKMFIRFFIEGRLINIFIPIIKDAIYLMLEDEQYNFRRSIL